MLFFFIASVSILKLECSGPDYPLYVEHYLGNSVDKLELGYEFICKLGRDLNIRPDVFFLLCFWFCIITSSIAIYKLCRRHNTSYIFVFIMYFSYLFYLHSFVQVRIGLALALLLIIYSMDNLNRLSRLILSCSCFLFHSSSVMFLIVYFFFICKKCSCRGNEWNKIGAFYISLPFVGFLILFLISGSSVVNDLLVSIELIAPRAGIYISSNEINIISAFKSKQILILLTLLSYRLFVYFKKSVYSEFELFCFKMSTISITFFIILSNYPSIAYRIFELFELFFIFLVSFFFKRNFYIGFFICIVYVLMSLRSVFFIDTPLLWIEG
ncbi:MAG: EpsG family protein [Aeromonas sp.]